MDLTIPQFCLYLTALFGAALVAGVTGFAFALIAAAVWLHILTPLQTATLTICYGLIVQGYGFWKMRHAFDWSRFWPYVVGSAPGIAIGVHVLRLANPAYMRMGIATFLALYAVYGLTRPAIKPIQAGTGADIAVGFVSGLLGAMAGFPGIIIVDLVHAARLAARCAARRIPAGERGAAGDVGDRLGCDGIDRAQHHLSVPGGVARACARHLGRLPAVRQGRR